MEIFDFRYIIFGETDILINRKDVRYVSFFRLLGLFLLLKNNDRVFYIPIVIRIYMYVVSYVFLN